MKYSIGTERILQRMTHDHCCKFRDALEDMANQFAYRSKDSRGRYLHTGGLSTLEHAFHALGWDDPHYVTDGGCEIDGCNAWATSVGAYPRSLGRKDIEPHMIGFGFLCSEHYRKWNWPDVTDKPEDLGRIPSAA